MCQSGLVASGMHPRGMQTRARSRPGRRDKQRDVELEAAGAEVERLRTALAEMAVRLTLAEGKERWG